MIKAIRRNPWALIRAQVGEPEDSRGYVERRSPFVFLIPHTGFAGIAAPLAHRLSVVAVGSELRSVP